MIYYNEDNFDEIKKIKLNNNIDDAIRYTNEKKDNLIYLNFKDLMNIIKKEIDFKDIKYFIENDNFIDNSLDSLYILYIDLYQLYEIVGLDYSDKINNLNDIISREIKELINNNMCLDYNTNILIKRVIDELHINNYRN